MNASSGTSQEDLPKAQKMIKFIMEQIYYKCCDQKFQIVTVQVGFEPGPSNDNYGRTDMIGFVNDYQLLRRKKWVKLSAGEHNNWRFFIPHITSKQSVPNKFTIFQAQHDLTVQSLF